MIRLLVSAALILFFSIFTRASADDRTPVDDYVLSVPAYHYPPQQFLENGTFFGPYVEEIEAIFDRAGITPVWLPMHMSEETLLLDRGVRPICTTGRVWLEERESRWRFVHRIFDQLPGALLITGPEDSEPIRQHETIEALVRNNAYKGVFVGKNAIADPFRQAIENNVPWVFGIAPSALHAARLVQKGRAHYTSIASDMWASLTEQHPDLKQLKAFPMKGLGDGNSVLIACSKAVPEGIMARLDKAMDELGYGDFSKAR